MDCAGVASLLVPYHFASVTADDQDAIDAHLVGCTACLKTYLALKRACEAGPLERPSPHVRARLRAEVARTFAPKPKRAIWSRRIPLYQGVVAAAIAAAIALAAPSVVHRVGRGDVDIGAGAPDVDTSRPRAESLQIY